MINVITKCGVVHETRIGNFVFFDELIYLLSTELQIESTKAGAELKE